MNSPASIYNHALAVAKAAAVAQNERLGGAATEQSRGFDVGFAWVTIKPARGAFVAYLKSINAGKTADYGSGPGYTLWYSKLHDVATQSMSVHTAAANAFADVLKANGINAVVGYRFD